MRELFLCMMPCLCFSFLFSSIPDPLSGRGVAMTSSVIAHLEENGNEREIKEYQGKLRPEKPVIKNYNTLTG